MQILDITQNIYKNIFSPENKQERRLFGISGTNLAPLKQDTVSFKGKNYNLDKIKEPTGHCAYCGEKVYSDEQIDSISTEIMKLKGARLTGKLRSILEKLEKPDSYSELSIQRRKVNKEHIAFFNKLSSYAQNSGSETGLDLLLKYSDFENEEEVKGEIKSHLKPLLRTIDHITPQRMNAENADEDINLVEACYACNHDLKKGMEFTEFHSMYPSIEKHMPQHKYQYALANVLKNSSSQVKAEISSQNLLELLETLSTQRAHAISTMDSINLRFKKCFEDIRFALTSSRQEKTAKEAEIAELEKKQKSLYSDEEHEVRQSQAVLENDIKELSERKIAVTGSITRLEEKLEELKNPQPVKGKKIKQLSPKDIEIKKAETQQNLEAAKTELASVDGELAEKQKKYDDLAKKYTPLSELTADKAKHIEIMKAYDKFEENKAEEETRQKALDKAKENVQRLEQILQEKEPADVKEADCSEDEKKQFGEYKALIDLMNKIRANKTPNDLNQQIYSHAIHDIDNQISKMLSNPLIAHAEYKRKQYLAKTKLPSAQASQMTAEKKLKEIQDEQKALQEKMAICTREQAEAKVKELEKEIARVQAIYDDLKIVEKINSAKAELKLIETTIANLETALKKEQEVLGH